MIPKKLGEKMRLRLVVLSGVILILATLPVWAGQDLKIVKWEPQSGPPAPAYVHLEVELPCDHTDFRERFTVNGQAAAFQPLGFASGSGRCTRDYAVYVGPPGKKEVRLEIAAGDRRLFAATALDFRSKGAIVLLDRVPGEAVLEPGEWRFWVYFVQDLAVRVNGREVPFDLKPTPVSPHHALLSLRPKLQPGPNLVAVAGKGLAGEAVRLECPTYLVNDRQVKLHHEILLPYGYLGSKSGPFFRLEVAGEALQAGERLDLEQAGLKEDAWFYAKRIFLKKLKAVKTGEAVLKFYEKSWFTNPYECRRTLHLRVVP